MSGTGEPAAGKKEVEPRMHSAEHVLTATLIRMIGCGRPFTTHLEKKKSKADYRFDRELTPDEVNALERRVNQVIASDILVSEEFLSREAAGEQYALDRLPDSAQTVRIVRIGDYDACPCIGPHVTSTKEIGAFSIVSTSWENGALRIRFRLRPPGREAA
jgi:Ser-tRNA(Ala) deacylase AlaX